MKQKEEKLPLCDCSPIMPHSHHETCPIYLDIVEQLKHLASLDHAIIGKKEAERICYPFGVKPRLTNIQDRRSEFKGAHFPKLKEGEWARDVVDASILAEQLCLELKVDYTAMFGRGSQLRECVEQLRNFWKVATVTE